MTNERNMDAQFDTLSVIPNLTPAILRTIPFMEMLEILRPLVLVQVPEEVETVIERKRYDYLLARLANLAAYLRFLFAFASYERDRLKKAGSESADAMLKKKEALYELVEATKLKYEAVSRKITLALEEENQKVSDRVDYEGRRAARDARSPQSTAPTTSKTAPPGGWGRVGA